MTSHTEYLTNRMFIKALLAHILATFVKKPATVHFYWPTTYMNGTRHNTLVTYLKYGTRHVFTIIYTPRNDIITPKFIKMHILCKVCISFPTKQKHHKAEQCYPCLETDSSYPFGVVYQPLASTFNGYLHTKYEMPRHLPKIRTWSQTVKLL